MSEFFFSLKNTFQICSCKISKWQFLQGQYIKFFFIWNKFALNRLIKIWSVKMFFWAFYVKLIFSLLCNPKIEVPWNFLLLVRASFYKRRSRFYRVIFDTRIYMVIDFKQYFFDKILWTDKSNFAYLQSFSCYLHFQNE